MLKRTIKKALIMWLAVILSFLLCLTAVFIKIEPMIISYAKSNAKTVMTGNAQKSVLRVLENGNITYDKLAVISRNAENGFSGIEIDTVLLNRLKGEIAVEIGKNITGDNVYDLKIPIGTLLANEYTNGFGPKITFKTQITQYADVDFSSVFTDAGLNQVLHQIIIKVNITATLITVGHTDSVTAQTSVIAAQTVIVGKVPDSYTNVEESDGSDVADKIFNYADLE